MGDFRIVQVRQDTASERLTPSLRGGWEGSLSIKDEKIKMIII